MTDLVGKFRALRRAEVVAQYGGAASGAGDWILCKVCDDDFVGPVSAKLHFKVPLNTYCRVGQVKHKTTHQCLCLHLLCSRLSSASSHGIRLRWQSCTNSSQPLICCRMMTSI